MGRKTENSGFVCGNCGNNVEPIKKGTIRNHCPMCLYSRHLDIKIGDRQSTCGGLMAPKSINSHSKKGWQILHVCVVCGHGQKNRLAEDDNMDLAIAVMRNQRPETREVCR